MKSKVFKIGLVLCMLLGLMVTGVHAAVADDLVIFKDTFEDVTIADGESSVEFTLDSAKPQVGSYNKYIESGTPVVTVNAADESVNSGNGQYLAITQKRPNIYLGTPDGAYTMSFDYLMKNVDVSENSMFQIHLLNSQTSGKDVRLYVHTNGAVAILDNSNSYNYYLQKEDGSWNKAYVAGRTTETNTFLSANTWYHFDLTVVPSKRIELSVQSRDDSGAALNVSGTLTTDNGAKLGTVMNIYIDPQSIDSAEEAEYLDNIEYTMLPTFAVNAGTADNGKVDVASSAMKGDTVTVTTTPNTGYMAKSVTVTDSNGNNVDVTDNEDGTYTFTMPARSVSVSAEFTNVLLEDDFENYEPNTEFTKAVAQAHGYYSRVNGSGTPVVKVVDGSSVSGDGQVLSVESVRPYIQLKQPNGGYTLSFDIYRTEEKGLCEVVLADVNDTTAKVKLMISDSSIYLRTDKDDGTSLSQKITYFKVDGANVKLAAETWYTVDLMVDLTGMSVGVKIADRDTNEVLYEGTVAMSTHYSSITKLDPCVLEFDLQNINSAFTQHYLDNISYKLLDTTKRDVTCTSNDNALGTVSVDKPTAMAGELVTVTTTPIGSASLNSITVTIAGGSEVDVTDKGNGIYTFTMPAEAVTVNAEFSQVFTFGFGVDLKETMALQVFLTVQDGSELSDWSVDGKPLTKANEDDTFATLIYDGIAAKDMCDEITITLVNGNQTVTKTTSIMEAAMAMYEDEQNAGTDLQTMMADLLNYGAAAQAYFTEDATLANAGLGDAAVNDWSNVEVELNTITEDDEDEMAYVVGTSLLLKDKTTLRLYFTEEVTSVNGVDLTESEDGDAYRHADVAVLTAKECWDSVVEYTFTVDGEDFTASETVSDYVNRVPDDADEYNVTRALMKLAQTASGYFAD